MIKKAIIAAMLALVAIAAEAKDVRTLVVTTLPQMHCSTCEATIKGHLRFEKGVKRIDTDIAAQTVTISYDTEKTDETTLIAAFERFGYQAEKVAPAADAAEEEQPKGE